MLLWGYRALSHATATSGGGGGDTRGQARKLVYLCSCEEVDTLCSAEIGIDI